MQLDSAETMTLLDSTDPLKDKVVYLGGFLTHKSVTQPPVDKPDELDGHDQDSLTSGELVEDHDSTLNLSCISTSSVATSPFLNNLSRGYLRCPTFSTTAFVHSAINVLSLLPAHKN